MAKMFVHYSGTKAEFIAAGLGNTYTNSIVFITGDENGNGSCIYTHGQYFGNFAEFIAAINYVKGINVGGQAYNAAQGGGYLSFSEKDPATVTVNASQNGIEIGLTEAFITKVDDVVALAAKIDGDYLKAADKQALTELINAASALAQQGVDAAGEVAADLGNVENLNTTAKTVVASINEVLTTVGNNNTAAAVTVEAKGASGDYAQVYEIKQGTGVVGTINIPKELVVQAGEVVVNPDGQAAGTYIKLTLQNVAEPLFIDVAKLVDIYTAKAGAAQVQLAISASNEISATIVAGSIGSTELADNAVITAKIADANVTKAKLSTSVQASLDKADAAAPQATTYTKDEVDALIEAVDLTEELKDYYTKSETYNKTEIDAMWEWEEI